MSTFDESKIRRGQPDNSGQFAAKPNSAPAAALAQTPQPDPEMRDISVRHEAQAQKAYQEYVDAEASRASGVLTQHHPDLVEARYMSDWDGSLGYPSSWVDSEGTVHDFSSREYGELNMDSLDAEAAGLEFDEDTEGWTLTVAEHASPDGAAGAAGRSWKAYSRYIEQESEASAYDVLSFHPEAVHVEYGVSESGDLGYPVAWYEQDGTRHSGNLQYLRALNMDSTDAENAGLEMVGDGYLLPVEERMG